MSSETRYNQVQLITIAHIYFLDPVCDTDLLKAHNVGVPGINRKLFSAYARPAKLALQSLLGRD